jgi:L-arabinokinase
VQTDTGVVQIDSLRLDAVETIHRAREFMTFFDQRIDSEVKFLRGHDVSAVIADLPPLAIAAAHAAGVPALAYGNFTWDWIYAGYPGGDAVARAIGDVYAHTTLALRLPMWGGFETMQNIRDIPFAARHSTKDPDDTRRALGIPLRARVVLASFGGYGVAGASKPAIPGYQVLWPGDVDEDAMYEKGYRYEDLVRAVDAIVTKPGYGIISECIANDTAMLYTSRGDFREYPVLVKEMPKYLRCEYLEQEALFSGNWQTALDRVLAQPSPPVKPATNGAQIAAELINP